MSESTAIVVASAISVVGANVGIVISYLLSRRHRDSIEAKLDGLAHGTPEDAPG